MSRPANLQLLGVMLLGLPLLGGCAASADAEDSGDEEEVATSTAALRACPEKGPSWNVTIPARSGACTLVIGPSPRAEERRSLTVYIGPADQRKKATRITVNGDDLLRPGQALLSDFAELWVTKGGSAKVVIGPEVCVQITSSAAPDGASTPSSCPARRPSVWIDVYDYAPAQQTGSSRFLELSGGWGPAGAPCKRRDSDGDMRYGSVRLAEGTILGDQRRFGVRCE